MTAELVTLYGLVLSLVAVSAVTHCPGMCGPLIIAFRFSGEDAGFWPGAGRFLCYQAGHAVAYLTLGAIAGALGSVVTTWFQVTGPWLLAGTALLLAGVAIGGLIGRPVQACLPGPVRRWTVGLVPRAGVGMRGPVLLGMATAFLPCGVAMQVVLLAVASGSPVHGALLMLVVPVLTTPSLLVCHALGRTSFSLLGRWRSRLTAMPSLLLLAGAGWMSWLAWSVAHAPVCH